MQKRLVWISTIVFCVLASFVLTKRALALQASVLKPVTIQFTEQSYSPYTEQLRSTVSIVEAIRADGSDVRVKLTSNPRGVPSSISKIRNTATQKTTVVDGLTQSTTTYALSSEVVKVLQNARGRCPAGAFANSETILGHDVFKATDRRDAGFQIFYLERWLAPSLNCMALREMVYLEENGGPRKLVTVKQADNIRAGEPDSSLFAAPTGYFERKPSEVYAEFNRRYGSDQHLNTTSEGVQAQDQAYELHAQRAPR